MPYYLSPSEIARAWMVHPETLSKGLRIMGDFERETGRRLFIPQDGGHRWKWRQQQLYADSLAAGKGKLAYPVADPDGQFAFHIVGAALDFHIVDGQNDNDHPDPLFARMAEIAERYGMRAGYRWTGKRRDVFHVEEDMSFAAARARWDTLTRERLWRAVGLVFGIVGLWLSWRTYQKRRTKGA